VGTIHELSLHITNDHGVVVRLEDLAIALGTGTGSEARRPLGIAIVSGLLFSQILTLYLTPVFYTYMEALRKNINKSRGKVELKIC
jgi:HAE1 family hydrophobic/amphiphilic exporter-1